jgi:chromosome segregation ATPase
VAVGLTTAPRAWADGANDGDKFGVADRAHDYSRDLAKWQAAKEQYDQAMADVVQQRRAAGEDYRNSDEYRAAAKEVDEACRMYNDKLKQVVDDIRKSDPRYAELKKQADAVDAEIAAARGNSSVTIQQFNDLYNRKAVFTREIKALQDDAMNKAAAGVLKQHWDDSSKQLSDLQNKQRAAVENSDRVKQALGRVNDAKTAMDEAGVALAGSKSAYAEASSQQATADEYLRRYPPSNYDPYWWGGWGYGYGWYGTSTYVGGDSRPTFVGPSQGLSR